MLNSLKRLLSLLSTSNLIALGLLLASIAAFIWLQRATPYNLYSEEGFQQLAATLGWRGPLLYMLVIAVAVVISQIPGLPLTLAAGALWGALPAGLYSVLGGFTGALIAYYLGHTLGRSVMKLLVGKVLIFSEERGERFLGVLIFVSRLLPLFPFDIISYAAGLSGLSVRTYALATLLGMIPSTLLLTYLGSAFTISLPIALELSAVALLVLVGLPIIIRRYNLWGLRDSIRFE